MATFTSTWRVISNESFVASIEDWFMIFHYDDVIMDAIASQITSFTIVYSAVYSDADQSKHQSSASLAFVRGIHRWPVNSPHKGPVTRKMFPFDDVIMLLCTMLVMENILLSTIWQEGGSERADFSVFQWQCVVSYKNNIKLIFLIKIHFRIQKIKQNEANAVYCPGQLLRKWQVFWYVVFSIIYVVVLI